METPAAVKTFVFADVEESALLWETCPEKMQEAMGLLDTLVAQVAQERGGEVVKSRGEEDTIFFAFPSAVAALDAVSRLQRETRIAHWAQTPAIRLRIALHTGEAQRRDNDYFGVAINRCAKLRTIAHGGQTILSEASYAAAQAHADPDILFLDLGVHRLRGLEKSEHIWQALPADISSEFPRLRSLQLHNLPDMQTRFVGRGKEIEEIFRRLQQARLLTLTGIGGCGKTRLSVQVARRFVDAKPDGVWFIELAPLGNPSQVARMVAQTLGITEQTGRNPLKTLAEVLRSRKLLLVLDNCEHLLDACVELAETLLEACPGVRILASSREPLGVADEETYRVPSLASPDLRRLPVFEELRRFEAVQLFLDRAQNHAPDFLLTPENAPAVAQICQRLDGIPLAIELAAARIRSLSVEEIATRLDNRFRLLTGGSRSSLPRQQTLRALIDWSYDLLNESERVLLCRVAVFAGGWMLDAAQEICSGEGIEASQIDEMLSELIAKSLVVMEEKAETPRYRLLETVRQYGLDKLLERGEGVRLRERHRDYFLLFVEERSSQLLGPEQAQTLQQFEIEHDNIRRAIDWCLDEANGAELSLRFIGNLWRFWYMHGHLSEGRSLASETLALLPEGITTADFANALNGAGVLAWGQGDYEAAQTALEKSLELRRTLKDRLGVAQCLNNLGLVGQERSDYDYARKLHQEALDIRREIEDIPGIHVSLNNLGNLAFYQGDYAEARRLYEESLALRRSIGERHGESHSLYNLALVADNEDDLERARQLYEESLAIRREFDDRPMIAYSLQSLGEVAMRGGDFERAAAYAQESLGMFQSLGEKRGQALAWMVLGDLALHQERFAEAREAYREAGELFAELHDRFSLARWLDALAGLGMARNRYTESATLFAAAAAMRAAIGVPRSRSQERLYRAYQERLLQTLPVADQEAAWLLGNGMSLDAALEFAFQQVND